MINIIKNFLTNQIIVNWVAPIITGLIVVVIPTILIRLFQMKKDKRKVDDANQRYLNSIRPYIIQKITIDRKFISDIRRVVIKESCIKEKYIYTEVELRNKLILDITEDSYISEIDKKINNNHKFSSDEIDDFLFKMKLFQKERIIHLVITLSYVFFTILFLFITKYIFAMFIIFFILLIFDGFYVYHYFFLENSVQYMYKQYDKMKNSSIIKNNRKEG